MPGYNSDRVGLASFVGGIASMTPPGSVSGWIDRARQGDGQAAGQLWQRYFHQLVKLARTALKQAPRRAVDEEDVALSAFDSFCRGAEQGRFPDLNDRANLWRLLVVLTRRKAAHLVRDERRLKRGGGAVLDQAALARSADAETEEANFNWVISQDPTPAFAAQMAEECERLLRRLDRAGFRELAVAKMEGYTNAEIAAQLGCCVSTVERRLQLIRRLWTEETGEDGTEPKR
jgi:DNA-directed RNA polymerase specialized sigma24 family protein